MRAGKKLRRNKDKSCRVHIKAGGCPCVTLPDPGVLRLLPPPFCLSMAA